MALYLFVYGALRRGQLLHHELVRAQAEFVGEARMRGRLYDLGRYPGAVAEGSQVIAGELYRLPEPEAAFRRLDAVEGRQYKRAIVRVDLAGGTQQAWAYLLRRRPLPK